MVEASVINLIQNTGRALFIPSLLLRMSQILTLSSSAFPMLEVLESIHLWWVLLNLTNDFKELL